MKKYILLGIGLLIYVVVVSTYQYLSSNDGKLHLIFCNVGQGDAILIQTPTKETLLVDGGPDSKVLDCLSNHLPFWEKTLSLVILTHPHLDHYAGLEKVSEVYSIKEFAMENISNESGGYKAFLEQIRSRNIKIHQFIQGSSVSVGGVKLVLVGPSQRFLDQTSPNGFIGESSEFGSLETLLTYKSFKSLLTGDSQATELTEAGNFIPLQNITVLQIPHHGSKTGLSEDLVSVFQPKIAVASVGKNNYGQPSAEAINLVGKVTNSIFRTDRNGEIEIITDGKHFEIKKGK